jgi:tRNA A-37 threonylcarbamoyl transferase component Bud32
MRDISELLTSSERYQGILIQKRFTSKKNTVAYVLLQGSPRVLKWYVPGLKANMETEASILSKGSAATHIPSLLDKDPDNNVLIMGYVAGTNLCDILNDQTKTLHDKRHLISSAAAWFATFHQSFKTKDAFRLRGDPTLRNFILKDDQTVWAVDFEESHIGNPVDDIAGFCASLLTTDPMFTTEKYELARHFIATYRSQAPWPVENTSQAVAYALLERIQWRPEHEDLFRKTAASIKKHGLLHKK